MRREDENEGRRRDKTRRIHDEKRWFSPSRGARTARPPGMRDVSFLLLFPHLVCYTLSLLFGHNCFEHRFRIELSLMLKRFASFVLCVCSMMFQVRALSLRFFVLTTVWRIWHLYSLTHRKHVVPCFSFLLFAPCFDCVEHRSFLRVNAGDHTGCTA